MPGKIFISYRRRDDPGGAGRLFDALNEAFDSDRLFLDVDSIEPGLDFVEVIEDRIAKSAVLLAVIGQHWIDASDDRGGRRIDNPQDYVRIEIESALKQNKRVIPVLIGDTKMPPPESLPDGIRRLARLNAVMLRYERFRDDMAHLTGALKHALGDDLAPTPPPHPQSTPMAVFAAVSPQPTASTETKDFFRGRAAMLACGLAAVAVLLAAGAYTQRDRYQRHDTTFTPASTSQPGWCQDPNLKPDELRVCATPGLLVLDDKLGHAFNDKLTATPSAQHQALRDDENKWLRDTRGVCAQDETCLYKVYRERITYFENLSVSATQ